MNEKYYKLTVDETLSKLDSSREGLTVKEASSRLVNNGLNKLKEAKRKTIISRFIDQLKNVMLIILLISAVFSGIISIKSNQSITDAIIIIFVVLLNAALGVLQESKAEKAIEALKNMAVPYIKVRRENHIFSIKAEELVIGDIVLLEAGDYVPADMRIILNHSLRVEESAITGESIPVDKKAKELCLKEEISIADRSNMIYSGSSVVYGRAEAIVTETGMNTELGKIANAISSSKVKLTPLQKRMNELSKMLSIIIICIAIFTLVVGCLKGKNLIDAIMISVSLAVAAIPEGLATVITITLAIGVQKMSKEKSIIRDLSSVETLGTTEVICSDKTGTLTQNKMELRKIYIDNKITDVNELEDLELFLKKNKLNKNTLEMLSHVFMLCNDTSFGEEKGNKIMLGDPTETALIDFGQKVGYNKEDMESGHQRVDEIPFDSERKMMTTVNVVNIDEYIVCTKGAVESLLEVSDRILINGLVEKLTDKMKDNILLSNRQMTDSALRVLACAYKELKGSLEQKENFESHLIFCGLVGMIDPPRKETKKAIQRCFNAGMIPVMITGDNKYTAIAIAKEIGIINGDEEAITGAEIDLMSDEELKNRVNDIRVYARVSPENKIRIVKAWKQNGKVVAMTGDGVNDAPALKEADIGIGMGITGTEVSKSVSSMILEDDNFSTIIVAIKEGRRIYNNIQNVIVYLLASNLAEVLIVFIATVLNKTVLLPIHLLWINLVTDTIPAIAIGFEKEEKNIMRQKPRKSKESLFTPFLTLRIIIPGILKSVCMILLYLLLENKYNSVIASTSVFLTLAIVEVLFAYICRSDKKSVFKIGLLSNKVMILSIVFTLILQFLIVKVPELSCLLKIPYMPVDVYAIIAITSISLTVIFEILKLILAKIFTSDR
jgi:Ca2+-transporting ATPase